VAKDLFTAEVGRLAEAKSVPESINELDIGKEFYGFNESPVDVTTRFTIKR
jgi:hypothetical protein